MTSRQVRLFSAALALVLGFVYWLSRYGFDDPVRPVVALVSIASFLLFLPAAVERRFGPDGPWFAHWSAVTVIGLSCVAVAGMISTASGVALWPLFGAIGLACVWYSSRVASSKRKPRASLLDAAFWLGLGGVFTAWTASAAWDQGYQNPLFVERIALHQGSLDTLFHIAISAMIRTYGVVSTGLDGLPYFPYHYGSHWLFAHLSSLAGIRVVTFYQVGYQVIVVPLLVQSILLFSLDVRARLAAPGSAGVGREAKWISWLLFAAAFTGFVPTAIANAGLAWPDLLVSQSYGLSIALGFMGGALALKGYSSLAVEERWPRWHVRSLLLVGVPLIVGLTGFAKVSVMLVMSAVAAYLFLRLKMWRSRILVGAAAVWSAVVVLSSVAVVSPSERMTFKLFGFIRDDVLGGHGGFFVGGPRPTLAGFLAVHYLWVWIFLAVSACWWWQSRADTDRAGRFGRVPRRFLSLEIVLVAAVAGSVPGLLFTIPGSSSYFFSDVQRWIASALLIAQVPLLLRGLAGVGAASGPSEDRAADGPARPVAGRALVVIGALAAIALPVTAVPAGQSLLQANLQTRSQLIASGAGKSYALVRRLEGVATLPMYRKRRSLVWISRQDRLFWEMLPRPLTPFLVPAFTEMGAVAGWPEGQTFDFYGYELYRQGSGWPRPPADAAEARARAARLGFDMIGLSSPR